MANVHPHLLIFEPDFRGHACEWVEHLLAELAEWPDRPRVSLLVAAELAALLEGSLEPLVAADRVRVITLSAREEALCTHRRLAVSGLARWWVMRRHLRRTGASRGLFLALDHLSLPLGLGLRTGRPVAGILFRPSVHYSAFGPVRPTAKERLRDARKEVLYRLMLANPALATVLSLDPAFPDFAIRHYRHGAKVAGLPDPAFPIPAPSATSEGAFPPAIPGERTVFVLFGELTARKGIMPLLDALAVLPDDIAGRIAVVIAGRVDASLRTAVHEATERLTMTRPAMWLHLEDRRLAMEEIAALVRRSDVVLAPYQRFVGSSGILMWAARMRRPVICQDYGLLGHLVRHHALGLTVDTCDPEALAGSIAAAVRRGPETIGDPSRMAAFADSHTAQRFAKTVLGYALAGSTETTTNLLVTRPDAAPKWSQLCTAWSQANLGKVDENHSPPEVGH